MKSSLVTWAALTGTVFAGCGGAVQEATAPVQHAQGPSSNNATLHPELPQIRSLEDAKNHAGKRAEIHGEYSISRSRSRILPVHILLADNTVLLRAHDVVSEEEHLRGRSVVIVGTVEFEPPGGPPRLTVETLVEAPGS